MQTHATAVPFPSTGGVDVSLHTLGPVKALCATRYSPIARNPHQHLWQKANSERQIAIPPDTAAAAIGMPLGRGGRKLQPL